MLQLLKMGSQQRPAQHIVPAASASPLGMTVEVQEDNKSLTFLVSLPGFSRDDIKVVLILPARVTLTAVSYCAISLHTSITCCEDSTAIDETVTAISSKINACLGCSHRCVVYVLCSGEADQGQGSGDIWAAHSQ